MRAAGWIVALATAMTVCTLRADLLYWMIAGEASDSFSAAYMQTLESANGKAENVVARLYSLDTSSGKRIDYEPAVGIVSEDDAGRMFWGESIPTEIPADSSLPADSFLVYGVQLGVLGADGSFTAQFSSEQLTYKSLDEMGAVQKIAVGTYDQPWNLATAVWTVPEPNGALLVLVGTALLALRRRFNA